MNRGRRRGAFLTTSWALSCASSSATLSGEGFGSWHQGFHDAGRSAMTVEAGDFRAVSSQYCSGAGQRALHFCKKFLDGTTQSVFIFSSHVHGLNLRVLHCKYLHHEYLHCC